LGAGTCADVKERIPENNTKKVRLFSAFGIL
jgi:hypothetical protein